MRAPLIPYTPIISPTTFLLPSRRALWYDQPDGKAQIRNEFIRRVQCHWERYTGVWVIRRCIFMILMAVWGLWRFFRKQGVDSNYWGALVNGEILIACPRVTGGVSMDHRGTPRAFNSHSVRDCHRAGDPGRVRLHQGRRAAPGDLDLRCCPADLSPAGPAGDHHRGVGTIIGRGGAREF